MIRQGDAVYTEYLKACAKTRWSEELWALTVAFLEGEGFARISYHHMPPLGAPDAGRVRVVTHGFPQEWVQDYIREKLFRKDPIPAQAVASYAPFRWSEVESLRTLTRSESDFLSRMAQAGLGDGLAVQVFGPGGRNGYFGLGFGAGDPPDVPTDALLKYQAGLQLAHLRYCHILAETLPPAPALSERERELLQWVALGKSNSVIADLMGISPHTVDAYMRRVFLKLGTSDRVSAAIRGLGSALIRDF
ncbi:LuxR family transcriptional regulator [Oceanibium sediminis]|uniref:LuxR family transcriptional regulator n=1 Tax=Oceanibium sediminis TaxID=2026339 RepID=UPI000DD37771|nr:LuxR family transcriptional regulator [Oceanibium sediminis]